MNPIPTFFCKYTSSLLKVFTIGCVGRRWRKPKEGDAEKDSASTREKGEAPWLYDPAIRKSVATGHDQDDVVEISLISEDEAKEPTSASPILKALATKAGFKARSDGPLQRPARAKLLDILIQFPLPPSGKDDGIAVQSPATPLSTTPKRLGRSARKQHRVERGSMDIVDFQSPEVQLMPLSPVSTRRSSLVWFADKSNRGDLSTDSNDAWVSIQRMRPDDRSDEWISEWRDDMATVLKGLQEVKRQEENEDFRDLLANASVSSDGYSALSRSSASLSGMRCSGDWAVQSFEL